MQQCGEGTGRRKSMSEPAVGGGLPTADTIPKTSDNIFTLSSTCIKWRCWSTLWIRVPPALILSMFLNLLYVTNAYYIWKQNTYSLGCPEISKQVLGKPKLLHWESKCSDKTPARNFKMEVKLRLRRNGHLRGETKNHFKNNKQNKKRIILIIWGFS